MSIRFQVNTIVARRDLAYERSQHCIVKAPNGTIWIIYQDSSGVSGNLLVAYSTDGGYTWTEETAITAGRVYGSRTLALVVDSGNIPMIVYLYDPSSGSSEIRYVDRSGGSWGTPETVYTLGNSAVALKACMDSGDAIHIAWDDNNEDDIGYITGTTGSWSNYEQAYNDQKLSDISVDSSDKPFICGETFVIDRTTGSWSGADTFDDQSSTGWGGLIALDSSDDIHIVWNDKGVTRNSIYYRKNTSGAWGTTMTVRDDTSDYFAQPILILDTSDDAYIIYQFDRGTTQNEYVWYKKIASGVLGSEVTLDATLSQPNGYPSTYTGLWHKYPSSGVLTPNLCPTVALLDETDSNANVIYLGYESGGSGAGILKVYQDELRYTDAYGVVQKLRGSGVASGESELPPWYFFT